MYGESRNPDWLTAIGMLVMVWVLASVVVANPRALPGPWYVATTSLPSFAIMEGGSPSLALALGIIGRHLIATLAAALPGLVMGLLVGAVVGMASGLGRASLWLGALRDAVNAVRNLPLFALIPLFVYWFPASFWTVAGYVGCAAFLLMVPAAQAAAERVPRNLIDLGRLLGARRWRLLRLVILPQVIPDLIPTVRWNVALMWAFSLGAEYAGGQGRGLGDLAWRAYLWSDMGRLLVIAWVYLAAGLVCLLLFDRLMARPGLLQVRASC